VHGQVLTRLDARLDAAGLHEPRVLDVGSGDGALAGQLAANGGFVTGLDPSPAALERARAAHPEIEWSAPAGDGRLPFADSSFDVVTCVNVLQHVADTQLLWSEMRRVLAPGGLLAVAVPNHGMLRNLGIALGAFERYFDPLEPVLRFYTAATLRRLFGAFGFESVETAADGGLPLLRTTLIGFGRRAGVGGSG
jgi:ubiquinone/menaquinone biosynthesis C-methylase UbiE